MSCFIDTLRPISPAETAAFKFYLSLPQYMWKAARMAFRRVWDSEDPGEAMIAFVSDTGVTDPSILSALETALQGLAHEAHRGGR